MVDSGAVRSVIDVAEIRHHELKPETKTRLYDIQKKPLPIHGAADIEWRLPSGRKAMSRMIASQVSRNVLSVGQSIDNGMTMVFSPQGSYMTRGQVVGPAESKREYLARREGLFFLDVEEQSATRSSLHR